MPNSESAKNGLFLQIAALESEIAQTQAVLLEPILNNKSSVDDCAHN